LLESKSGKFFAKGLDRPFADLPVGLPLPSLDRVSSAAPKDQAGNFPRSRPARSFAHAAAVV
jgi:hypothetical protein